MIPVVFSSFPHSNFEEIMFGFRYVDALHLSELPLYVGK